MDVQKFNFLLLTTQGRVRTMVSMSLDNAQKLDLAKTGLFFHNNMIKCIGCHTTMDKIDAKRIKQHTFSENCISAFNALMVNEGLRKRSFSSFKWARRQFKAGDRVIDMLSRRGYYCFGKRARLRCAGCKVVLTYVSVDDAQKSHDSVCTFRQVVSEVDLSEAKILQTDLPPPRSTTHKPTAPPPSDSVSECKVCFVKEKSVCFFTVSAPGCVCYMFITLQTLLRV